MSGSDIRVTLATQSDSHRESDGFQSLTRNRMRKRKKTDPLLQLAIGQRIKELRGRGGGLRKSLRIVAASTGPTLDQPRTALETWRFKYLRCLPVPSASRFPSCWRTSKTALRDRRTTPGARPNQQEPVGAGLVNYGVEVSRSLKFTEPMLLAPASTLPEGPNWSYEVFLLQIWV